MTSAAFKFRFHKQLDHVERQTCTDEVLPSPSTESPLLSVHIVEENAVARMDIETYVDAEQR